MEKAGTQSAWVLADADFQHAVMGRGGKGVEARHWIVRGQNADQIAGFEPRQSIAQKAPPESRWTVLRQDEPKHGGRRLHLCAIVHPFGQLKRDGARWRRRVRDRQIRPDQSADLRAPARKRLRRLPVDRVQRVQLRPALCGKGRLDILRELAEPWKLTVAEAEHGHRQGCRGFHVFQPREKLPRGGRGRPVTISGRQDQHAPGAAIAAGKLVHRRGVDAVPGPCQRIMQCLGKSPGAVALAADQDHRIGCCRPDIAL